MQSTTPFEQSPSNHLPLNPQLKCGETYLPPDTTFHNNDVNDDDDDNDTDFYHHVQSYNFHVTLPPPPPNNAIANNNAATPTATRQTLEFYSRERSSGTGILHPHHDDEMTTLDTVYDGPMDPHFFERGFYLEAKTGFQVWPGSRLLLEALLCDLPPAVNDAGAAACGGGNGDSLKRLRYWQKRLRPTSTTTTTTVKPLHILEVGSGIGVVGTTLAAAGGHVLMTDLPVLVHHGIRPNLLRNRKKTNVSSAQVDHVTTNDNDKSNAASSFSFLATLHPIEQGTTTTMTHPIPIGSGYARPTVLDWFQPIRDQLASTTVSNIHVIVACDCIFLTKIVDPLLDTVGQIFDCCMERDRADRRINDAAGGGEEDGREGTTTTCLFTYQKRNLSGVFISLEELLRRIETRGWSVRCLAWRKVMVEEDGEHDLYLFEMSSRRGCADDGWGRCDSMEVPCEEKKE
ncbi:hypothetical protein HJC23_005371 [Cyclotella cryptica]|uniref:Uncharacterized protein n=1 Tax=Cyclotella cryptica TaxID=29204 RepID=A0ABD3NQJ1_9STRA|eukprot:CCRYP_020249-RA/>CCRYP_020249-RA protein AED:0.28 eAED:0.28 QI:0/-1/0/1/-1/1/1/0/457